MNIIEITENAELDEKLHAQFKSKSQIVKISNSKPKITAIKSSESGHRNQNCMLIVT